ncbi:MAG: hypothetical protein NTX54_06510 [Chloroflexi bacterium]|nr:hypothetical protein [Chloroflexota bacterium]
MTDIADGELARVSGSNPDYEVSETSIQEVADKLFASLVYLTARTRSQFR